VAMYPIRESPSFSWLMIGRYEERESLTDFIPDATKRFNLQGCRRIRRILESPVNRLRSGKNRAELFGPIANGDDVIEHLSRVNVHILGCLSGDVNSGFLHD